MLIPLGNHGTLTACFAGLPAGEGTGEDAKSTLSSPITTWEPLALRSFL